MKELSIGILAGGKSSRFGTNKLLSKYMGHTFIEHLYNELSTIGDTYISVDNINRYKDLSIPASTFLEDTVSDIGPMEGIKQLITAINTEYIFITAGDTPLINGEFVDYLRSYISNEYDGYVIINDKKVHPLCGIYRKSILEKLDDAIKNNRLGITRFLNEELNIKYIDIKYSKFSPDILENINEKKDYKRAMKGRRIVAISGVKNSGKTTLITKLIPELKKYYNNIAVIKHDGHDFDVPNTDTYKYYKAGASNIGIFSDSKSAFFHYVGDRDEKNLINHMKDSDLIILEGFKNSSYPKIEVIRKNNSKDISSNTNNLKAIITDIKDHDFGYKTFNLDDIKAISKYIIDILDYI